MSVEVPVLTLIEATKAALDDLATSIGSDRVTLDEDYYWVVPNVYDLDNEPRDFHVGSLFDDLDFIEGALAQDPPFQKAIMLIHLLPLIAYLARKGGISAVP